MQLLANPTSPFVRIARIALLEKGFDIAPTWVDPWADDSRLRTANPATRVPTLILADGTAMTESLLIIHWLEALRPAPQWPSLTGVGTLAMPQILARAGLALGGIDASVHTIITRKVTAPALFDESPVGLRRRRTMMESLQRLEIVADEMMAQPSPMLDAICAVVLYDYQWFRYAEAGWLPETPRLQALAQTLRERASFSQTMPRAQPA